MTQRVLVTAGAGGIGLAIAKAFAADGVIVAQFSEPAAGQEVYHLHMHVMPRKHGVELLPPASRKEDPAVLADHAAKLIAALDAA